MVLYRLWFVTSQQTLDTFLVFNFDKRLGCPHFLHVFSHQFLNTLNPTLSYIRQFHGVQRVHRSERCTRHGFEELWAPWCCQVLKSRSNEYLFAEEGDFSRIGGSNFGWGSTSLWYWFSKAHSIHIVCFFWKFDHHAQCLTFEGRELSYFPDGQFIFQNEAFLFLLACCPKLCWGLTGRPWTFAIKDGTYLYRQ